MEAKLDERKKARHIVNHDMRQATIDEITEIIVRRN